MTEVKVRLSMSVLGAQLLSSQECEKDSKNYNVETITVVTSNKKGKVRKDTLVIKTRKNRVVKQCLNISKEAYDSMIDASQHPTERLGKKIFLTKTITKNGKPKKVTVESTAWAQMPPIKRLNWHMSRIAESLGAVDYQFEILDD